MPVVLKIMPINFRVDNSSRSCGRLFFLFLISAAGIHGRSRLLSAVSRDCFEPFLLLAAS
jgi:hypothetical protein